MLAWHSRRQIVSLYGWMDGWMEREGSPLNPPFLPLMFNFIKTPYNQTSLKLGSLALRYQEQNIQNLTPYGSSRRDKRLLRVSPSLRQTHQMASFRQQICSASNYVHLHGIKAGRNSAAAPRLGTIINMTRDMADGECFFWEEEGVFLRCCLAFPES